MLPHAIARLKIDRPLLTVIVREGSPEALLVELEAGRIDMIVGRLTAPTTETAIRQPLYDEFVEVFTRVQHPLGDRTELALRDLAEFPWILPGTETVLRGELEEFFARNGMPLPENRVEATSFLTVRQLLLETDLVAVLPSLIGRSDDRLRTLPVSLDTIGHSVGITIAAMRALSPSATVLADNLRQVAVKGLQESN